MLGARTVCLEPTHAELEQLFEQWNPEVIPVKHLTWQGRSDIEIKKSQPLTNCDRVHPSDDPEQIFHLISVNRCTLLSSKTQL